MKNFDISRLVDLEDDTIGRSSLATNQLNNAVDLLYWIDARKDYLPLSTLISKGYISSTSQDHDVFQMLSSSTQFGSGALFKSGKLEESAKRETIVAVWQAVVCLKAQRIAAPRFKREDIDTSFLNYIASLSTITSNILNLNNILLSKGIILIIEPAFPGLGKDGCVYKNQNGNPVLAISIRYNRLDNFWFTLLHELSHIILHYDRLDNVIIEDLEDRDDNEIEEEANYMARESIVNRILWRKFSLGKSRSKNKLIELAEIVNRHPALIAGRIRHETKDWSLFSDIINDESPREVLGL